jgi:serine/threonine protein phosphatase PrpC
MPDAQVLYVVTAAVVLGLIAWVIVVLTRAERLEPVPVPALARQGSPSGGGATTDPDTPAAKDAQEARDHDSLLDPHNEIQDSGGGPVVHVEIEEDEEPTGPNALILVTAVGKTDPGLKRKHNEDAYATLMDHHVFVIADGMGRHAAGEVASQLCVEAISKAFETNDYGRVPFDPALPRRSNRLRSAILEANAVILAAAQENEAHAGMGTTVVTAYFSPNNQRVYIAHVGDSRCYRLRDGKLQQLTQDHTLGAAGIQGKSAAVLSRAVGVEENVEVDLMTESPQPKDIYLLCSDGLSRMLRDEEIESTLLGMTDDLEGATKTLISLANERGGRDNITAILVRVQGARESLTTAKASS